MPEYDARTFYATTSYGGASFSADESRILFSSDATGVFNAYSVPVAGGEPTRLTNSTTHAVTAVGYFPRDDRILSRRTRAATSSITCTSASRTARSAT